MPPPIRVLVIDDDADASSAMREMLAGIPGAGFVVEASARLADGAARLARGGIDLVLLDLGLPDSQGLATFEQIRQQPVDVPVVILTGLNDEASAVRAVQAGAQDYLVKGEVTQPLIVRALRYAVERYALQRQLRGLSLVDELTGLHNRRGFVTLAEQQLKLADRVKRPLLLIFVDLDYLKRINDTWGHAEGDRALIETAAVLRQTFRKSDILARIGGDEFAVLAIEYAPRSDQVVLDRLANAIELHNARHERPFPLALSVGTALYDPAATPCPLEALMAQADRAMYARKQQKAP